MRLLNNKRFISNLDNIKNNWLDIPLKEVTDSILNFMEEFEKIIIN